MPKNSGVFFPLYCDDNCKIVKGKGTWTKTRAGHDWCQCHAAVVETCEVCVKRFHTNRVSSVTCSTKCRVAKHRANRLQIGSVTKG